MFTNQDLKKLIIPLFLEQLLVALAGRSFCTLIGIVFFSHHVQEILLRDNRDSQFFRFFIL